MRIEYLFCYFIHRKQGKILRSLAILFIAEFLTVSGGPLLPCQRLGKHIRSIFETMTTECLSW